MNKSIAVLGMGRFGKRLTDKLIELGADVLIADNDSEVVAEYADEVSYAATADLTSAEAIAELDLSNMDTVVVAMGGNLEASIMCVMISKELGVPEIIAQVSTPRMETICRKLGADKVIYPEEEAANATARKLVSNNFIDYFELNDELSIVNLHPKEEWIGKSLIKLKLRDRYGINVIAVRKDDNFNTRVDPQAPLTSDMDLLVIANSKELDELL